jgi:hypothetical protein
MSAGLFITLTLYTLVFILAELLYQRGVSKQVTRKIVHIGGGIVSALLPALVSLPSALALGLFCL